jgi:hypothetical protein
MSRPARITKRILRCMLFSFPMAAWVRRPVIKIAYSILGRKE